MDLHILTLIAGLQLFGAGAFALGRLSKPGPDKDGLW